MLLISTSTFVSSGCKSKIPQTGWLRSNRNFSELYRMENQGSSQFDFWWDLFSSFIDDCLLPVLTNGEWVRSTETETHTQYLCIYNISVSEHRHRYCFFLLMATVVLDYNLIQSELSPYVFTLGIRTSIYKFRRAKFSP